jgi:hypothetical protein
MLLCEWLFISLTVSDSNARGSDGQIWNLRWVYRGGNCTEAVAGLTVKRISLLEIAGTKIMSL